NTGRHRKQGWAQLHLSGAATSHPVIVIESSLSRTSPPGPSQQEPLRRYPIPRTRGSSYEDLRSLLYRDVLLPIVDTVCVFAADCGGIRHVQHLLASWGPLPPTGLDGAAAPVRPRWVIVLTDPDDDAVPAGGIETTLQATAVPHLAGSVAVVDLRPRQPLSRFSRFEPLRRRLSLELDEVRTLRANAHLLFSALHLEWIFRGLLRHVAQGPASPFNCIQACRPRHLDADEVAQYLGIFLQLAEKTQIADPFMATFIASAFLMDAYPPGMHRFDPVVTFRTFYAGPCKAACAASPSASVRRLHRAVEREFVSLFSTLAVAGRSAQIRREVFRNGQSTWSTLHSNRVCLFCLQRPPEHVLPCRHALCDVCACILGQRAAGAEYHVELTECPACQASFSLTVRLLPPTKRPTILVLDGGGTRGVVTLGFLKALEDQIGRTRGLREAFDLTLGTSVGAIIASDVMVCGANVADTHPKFDTLARQIFSRRPLWQTILGQSWGWVTAWMADSRYDSAVLDRTVQDGFGRDRRLFDTTKPLVSGIRVALTASQVEDGSLCLFSNYRAAGRLRMSSAYRALVPEQEPFLWEIARCCVAALGYFTPKRLPGLGTFQDGGVRANCPLRTALRESEIIWPTAKRPDLVVSIGTGYPSADDGPVHLRRESFVERGLRAFLSSPAVDGRRGWQDAHDSIPESVKQETFRLDRVVSGALPELDDVRALHELGEYEYHIPDELTQAWLAKSFFFELDEEPLLTRGHYECRGSILCCEYGAAGLVEQILSRFPGARFALDDGSDLGAVDHDQGCLTCGYYRKRVTFRVSSIHQTVQLGIRGVARYRAIGGFPTSIHDLLHEQQADCPFGRADHRSDFWPPVRRCYCPARKRSHTSMQTERAAKRRRL
ncbi:hypothetical protein RU639_013816, partial [Aspergillus parasiticus]